MNFDDWFNTGKNWQYDKDACEDAFEAGQKSRQEDVEYWEKVKTWVKKYYQESF